MNHKLNKLIFLFFSIGIILCHCKDADLMVIQTTENNCILNEKNQDSTHIYKYIYDNQIGKIERIEYWDLDELIEEEDFIYNVSDKLIERKLKHYFDTIVLWSTKSIFSYSQDDNVKSVKYYNETPFLSDNYEFAGEDIYSYNTLDSGIEITLMYTTTLMGNPDTSITVYLLDSLNNLTSRKIYDGGQLIFRYEYTFDNKRNPYPKRNNFYYSSKNNVKTFKSYESEVLQYVINYDYEYNNINFPLTCTATYSNGNMVIDHFKYTCE